MKSSYRNLSFELNSLNSHQHSYFDYRCEFDVPRFFDFSQEESTFTNEPAEIFTWFQTPRDFDVNSNLVAKHQLEMLKNSANLYTTQPVHSSKAKSSAEKGAHKSSTSQIQSTLKRKVNTICFIRSRSTPRLLMRTILAVCCRKPTARNDVSRMNSQEK